MDYLKTVLAYLLTINIALALMVVVFERRNPASTWAWILVLFFIPVFGFFIYLIIGRNKNKRKSFISKSKNDQSVYLDYIKRFTNYKFLAQRQQQSIHKKEMFVEDVDQNMKDLIYLNLTAGAWLTRNNEIEIYQDGYDKFSHLLQDLKEAKEYVHVLYYIIRNDCMGHLMIEALKDCASRGVDVRFLHDGMGQQLVPKSFFHAIEEAGGHVSVFSPPLFTRINFRNHRKLCIIDGRTGYIGGFNIGDEYLGIEKRYGKWRDTHMRVQGEVVLQMELRFMMDWNFCSSKKMQMNDFYFPRPLPRGTKTMQVVSSGPDCKLPNIQYTMFKMINEANEKIIIQSPYFVPDDSILEALKVAALSGIDVKIMIPGIPDHPFVYWAGISYLSELLDAGVKCYQYEGGFMHSKVLLIDGKIATVGTANMDVRSFQLNFEINSVIFDKEITARFEAQIMEDLLECREITHEMYRNIGLVGRVKEAVSRLISPLL